MKTNLEAALGYARRGWKVLPLRPNGKVPYGELVPHGAKDATLDAAIIRGWWERSPEANVGIATGVGDCGPYVVDIDAPSAAHKYDGAASLRSAGIELPATLEAVTPHNGRHLYYGSITPLSADRVKCCANVNGLEGVDTRGAGGYIVAPPSTIDGKPYAFVNERKLETYPAALYAKPKPPPVDTASLPPRSAADTAAIVERAKKYLKACDPAIEHQVGSNPALHAAHALVVGFALDDSTALHLLESEYNPKCEPPWSEKELLHKMESARADPQKPFGYLLNAPAPIATAQGKAALTPKAQTPEAARSVDDTARGLSFAERYAFRRTLRAFPNPIPEEQNPLALFQGGWLRKGGGAMFISVSGAGKSVAATQFCDCWAFGRDFFGIKPVRPLRIAVYQAEDDDTEVADFRDNIRRGLLMDGWTPEEVSRAEDNITYHNVTGLAGEEFLDFVQYAQLLEMADLIIINPLYAFAGRDLTKNDELSHFLRVRLNPILANPKAPCGCLIIHHTNKVPKGKERKDWLDLASAAYAGAGGAELVNWSRAVLTLRPYEAQGYYDLLAAKRGGRLKWKDAKGNSTIVKPIAHSAGLYYWREPSPEEVEQANKNASRAAIRSAELEQVKNLVTEHGEPFESRKALAGAITAAGMGKTTKANKLIDECEANGLLVSRSAGGSYGQMAFGTPEQWGGVTDEPTDDEVVENFSSLDCHIGV